MRLNKTFTIISLILLLCLTFTQDLNSINSNTCPDQLIETLLQSGTNVLNNPKTSNQRSLSFQVNVNYNIPSQGLNVAISTGLISGYNQGLGTDYSIRAVRVNQTNTVKIYLYINSDRSWTSIKASYLISSRPDFFLGSFVTQSFDLLRSSGDSYLVENQLANWSFTNRKMKYIYLISGVKTADNLFNINLSEANFNNENGKITIRITTNAIPNIQLLYITYVIFQEQAPFTLQNYNPLSNNIRADFNIEGLDEIRGNALTYEGFGLFSTSPKIINLNCIGSACQNRCISTTECSNNRGVISQRNCYLCGINQFYSNNQCLPVCGQNEILNNNICVCKTGFNLVNGQCRPIVCRQNQNFNGVECVCVSGFRRINGVCQLESTICPSNSFYNGLECICVSGFVKIGSRCASICTQNGYLNDSGSCVCLDGFTFVNGNCERIVSCTKPNQINVNNRCQCLQGFEYNSFGNCVQIQTVCRVNEQLVNGNCVCLSGFVRNSFGTCVPIQCSANQILSNGNCICFSGYQRNSQGVCVKSCGSNEFLSNDQCFCLSGFVRNSFGICVPVSCGTNQVLINNVCQCRQGFVRTSTNTCVLASQCRVNQVYDQSLRSCICRQGYGLNPSTGLCAVCPANSRSSGLLSGCLCNTGYTWSSVLQRCVNVVCSTNFVVNENGVCVCANGFYNQNGQCKQVPICPSRSTWNPTRLSCVCDSSSENLINGICQGCQVNSGWNGTQCVCRSGFFLINGVCTECSSNSEYIRGNCVCKFSYFGNGINCSPCHSSCGTCTSQFSNSCLSCANASYTLSNGVCTLGLCDKGNFFNNVISKCDKCLQYCDSCSSKQTCNSCIAGFTKQTTFIAGSQVDACIETCGDGKRFYLQCDDGNKVNGDGCNANCQVENGWTCVGGSSTTRSSCSNTIPTSSRFIIGGHVILQGQVLQGLSMTYLPPSLTNNGCPQCDDIFNVSIISSPVIPSITVDYIQATQYRYVIRFNFQGSLANFAFSYSIRINERFRQFFTTQDLEQIQTVKIDMALLAKIDNVGILNLDEDVTVPSISTSGKPQTISIDGVPSNAIKILFPQ